MRSATQAADQPVGTGSSSPLPGARTALMLLLLINLFNYIDRQVLAAVLPKIEAAFLPDDPDPKGKLGLLTTAFMVAYMVLAPLFGWLGDRMSRWLLAGVGVILWSLATGATGLATGFLVLLLTRCCVGVGEAAYGPVAPGIISDLYPVSRRGSVLAWFYVAIPVGSALGYVLGGAVAGLWRWQYAFLMVVPPGLLLGLWCFRMPEPPRGLADKAPSDKPHSWRDYRVLWQTRSYVLDTLGMLAMTFVLGGVGAWMPYYVYDREARFSLTADTLGKFEREEKPPADVRGRLRQLAGHTDLTQTELKALLNKQLDTEERKKYTNKLLEVTQTSNSPSLGKINLIFGSIVVLAGLVATLLGGMAGDRLRSRFSGSYFLVSGAGLVLGFPFFLGVLFVPFPLAWVMLFAAVFCLFFNTGPTNTILANVSPPSIRSSAFALNILIIHALGDAISPAIIGTLADHSSLGHAFLVVSVLLPLGGVCWLWGARYLASDTARAPTRLSAPDV